MNLLVLGGTAFLGRAVVAEALRRGDRVTTFTRGRTGLPPPEVEALHGDRTVPGDLARLAGRSFDAVVDTSGMVPRVVGASARLLAGNVGHYAYLSSISVYPDALTASVDETFPVFPCPPDAGPEDGDYGELKAGCERAVLAALPDRALLVRAGLLLGPHEDVGRLPWWLSRLSRGGEVLAPGRPGRPLQYVDVRDLADWLLDRASAGTTGVFNATGSVGAADMGSLLAAGLAATGGRAELTWVDEDFLAEHQVVGWTELPVWVPERDQRLAGLLSARTDRALASGLSCRPVEETVADTWAWLRELPAAPLRAGLPAPGLDPDKERRVLDAWHRRTGPGVG